MVAINVFMATFKYKCASCDRNDDLTYRINLGKLGFFLCEECAERLYHSLELEVIVPDQREW